MNSLFALLVHLLIGGLILSVIWWALSQFALPEPINKIVRVLVVVIALIWLLSILFGNPLLRWY